MSTLAMAPGYVGDMEGSARGGVVIRRLLLWCGAASAALYVATDILGGLRYPGFSFSSQTISEVAAVGAPTEPFVDTLLFTFDLLALAFAVGVLLAAGGSRALLVVGALLAAREVLEANNRNLPVVGLVLLFGTANAVDYLCVSGIIPAQDLGWQLAIGIVVLLISLIGGRIVPSFTRNWMAKRGIKSGLPTQPGRFDMVVIVATAFALLAWLTGPDGLLLGIVLLATAALQAVRLARWRGLCTWPDPLVLILHVGYAWVPVGLALLGLSSMDVVPRSAAIHALTAGAMATMILAVMTRASLGHTGRELNANAATIAVYVLVTTGAILRVAASFGWVDYALGIEIAGLAWGGALLLFLLAYAPVLWTPRLGES